MILPWGIALKIFQNLHPCAWLLTTQGWENPGEELEMENTLFHFVLKTEILVVEWQISGVLIVCRTK